MLLKEIPFRPKLEGEFRNRFYHMAASFNLSMQQDVIFEQVSKEIHWVENECNYNLSERKTYRACLYVLRDLVNASWKCNYKDGVLLLSMPELELRQTESMSLAKEHMRKWMSDSRLERIQLSAPFISSMEQGNSTTKSIECLIADGKELSGRLKKVLTGDSQVTDAVKPYLQLVEENLRDEYTNIKLSDIWRYFRQTWSTPHETTPGRTVQYLIRDAAEPNNAVMGIMSLENCAVQITDRDNYIGWNANSYIDRVISYDVFGIKRELDILLNYIQEGIHGIKISGLCTKNDCNNPTIEIVNKLSSIAEEAENQRQESLKTGVNDDDKSSLGQISKTTEEALYLRKRADNLSKLLKAKILLKQVRDNIDSTDSWVTFCKSESGISAIRSALVAQKTKHIGSSMMELNVCGAIPPYNHILGGKLVALLATSPQVIHDYKNRYVDKPSEIASRLKGKDVCRPADLVYIGTTSLYDVGSSQYNRLKIPGSVFNNRFDISWKEIGKTLGYGTWHISRATTFCLNEVSNSDVKKINHVFGEGASPKLRLITDAFPKILEDTNDSREFARHSMRRIVFGAFLASNAREYLLGIDDKPNYPYSVKSFKKDTEEVIKFWQMRWLKSRLNYTPIFDRIEEFSKSSLLVSNDIQMDSNVQVSALEDKITLAEDIINDSTIEYVKLFYRGSSAYADNIYNYHLNRIHIETKLDASIKENLSRKKDVILTGNPGDGKTHIMRIILQSLNKDDLITELDASTKTNEELYSKWKLARENGKPFFLAINAAVLLSLHQEYPDYQPISEAYKQMVNSVRFDDSLVEDSNCDVILYDLSKRDVLSKHILSSAIRKLTDEQFYEKCSNCTFYKECDVQKNRILLNNKVFQERLSFILERVSLLGYHATLREVQSLISYLIFADRDCLEIAKTSGKYEFNIVSSLYKGQGELFNQIRSSFDPIKVSHPIWDEKIINNSIDPDSWELGYVVSNESINPDNIALFDFRKRQFYFFNNNGSDISNVLDDDVAKFQQLFDKNDKQIKHDVISGLNAFFSSNDELDLNVWTGHRFDTQPRKVLISNKTMKTKDFEIGRPSLSNTMSNAIDVPLRYFRFSLKNNPDIYLKIDFEMFQLFEEAKRGTPVLFIEQEASSKVWRFMEKLNSSSTSDEISISLMDLQTKKKVHVEIEEDEDVYKYMSIKVNK